MKTDNLIAALAADHPRASVPIGHAIAAAMGLGAAVSLALFVPLLGLRPDLLEALQTWRFDLKLAIVALAVAVSAIDCLRLASPLPSRHGWWHSLVPALLVSAAAVELVVAPRDTWAARLVGTNALDCLAFVSILAVAPLIALLVAMRSGAPSSPARAGAAAGSLAASAAALLYALHCFDNSPLFVLTWYSLAAIPVVLVGAAVGHRLLRW